MGYLDLHLILSPMYAIPENWWHLNLKVYKWMQCQSLSTLNLPVLSYRHLPLSLTDKHRQENQGSKERGWLASLFSWRIRKTWFILFLIKYAKWRFPPRRGSIHRPQQQRHISGGVTRSPPRRGGREGGKREEPLPPPHFLYWFCFLVRESFLHGRYWSVSAEENGIERENSGKSYSLPMKG